MQQAGANFPRKKKIPPPQKKEEEKNCPSIDAVCLVAALPSVFAREPGMV
jgi:hypothetical protein